MLRDSGLLVRSGQVDVGGSVECVKVEGERNWDGLVKVVWDVRVVEGEAESVPDVFVDAVEFVA